MHLHELGAPSIPGLTPLDPDTTVDGFIDALGTALAAALGAPPEGDGAELLAELTADADGRERTIEAVAAALAAIQPAIPGLAAQVPADPQAGPVAEVVPIAGAAPLTTAPIGAGPETAVVASPEVASPEVASPEVASPEVASPEVASPEVASPEVASPEPIAAHVADRTTTTAVPTIPGAADETIATTPTVAAPRTAAVEAEATDVTGPATVASTEPSASAEPAEAPVADAAGHVQADVRPPGPEDPAPRGEPVAPLAPETAAIGAVTTATSAASEPTAGEDVPAVARVDAPAPRPTGAEHAHTVTDAAPATEPGTTTADAAAPGRPTSTQLAQRIAEAVEQLENAPPPQRVTLELGDLRLHVALRGTTVHVSIVNPDAAPTGDWSGDLSTALSDRGFSLADGSLDAGDRRPSGDRGRSDDRHQPGDQPEPTDDSWMTQPGRPGTDPTTTTTGWRL